MSLARRAARPPAAAQHADSALNAEREGTIREALRQWDLVFNGQFPG